MFKEIGSRIKSNFAGKRLRNNKVFLHKLKNPFKEKLERA